MEDSIYNSLFGALSNEHRMDIIANNLANVNTTGFKKDKVAFHDVFQTFAHDRVLGSQQYLRAEPLWPEAQLLTKPRLTEEGTDFTQGAFKETGNPLDLAISGDGFFTLQSPGGETFYTRNGSFMLNQDGQIVDANGNYLMGQGGPIQVPPGTGTLTVDPSGQMRADGTAVDTVRLVAFDDPGGLLKQGGNLFTVAEQGAIPEIEVNTALPEILPGSELPQIRATVVQGFLESSNVEVVTEMVSMIDVQRSFEAYQKMMQSAQQLDQKLMTTTERT